MAVVYAKGAPVKIFPEFMPALYGSVYTLKFDLKKKRLPTFKVTGLRACYPDSHLVPMDEWTMIIGLPVPEDTTIQTINEYILSMRGRLNWTYPSIFITLTNSVPQRTAL
ncbi:unnamed protein product [marine sediment metagenome]|uniref:GyrI-like small molecule binding domain-containing protein n=1 Tax=marine sediment metagenome TaxID=412755 RepID=X1AG29_9ZZZZ